MPLLLIRLTVTLALIFLSQEVEASVTIVYCAQNRLAGGSDVIVNGTSLLANATGSKVLLYATASDIINPSVVTITAVTIDGHQYTGILNNSGSAVLPEMVEQPLGFNPTKCPNLGPINQ
jgi:hypothetical protein